MLHPDLAAAIARDRYDRLLQEAETERLLRVARAGKLRLHQRFVLRLGDMLIACGLRLRAPYEPAQRLG